MGERNVPVGNIVEEMDLLLVVHEPCRDGVYWGITPSLVEEATILIQGFEEVNIRLAAQPLQATNLEV